VSSGRLSTFRELNVGALADGINERSELDSRRRLVIAKYTIDCDERVGDETGSLSFPMEDFPDLLQIGLDLLMEYEHASPGSESALETLKLYDSREEPASVFPCFSQCRAQACGV